MKEIAIDNPELQFLSCLTGACVGEEGGADGARCFRVVEEQGVDKEWFRDPRYQKVFEAMMAEFKEFGFVDMFKVVNRLKDGAGLIDTYQELIDAYTTTAHLEHYINQLRKRHVYHVIHRTGYEFLKELNPDNVVESVETFSHQLANLQDLLANGDKELMQLSDFREESIAKKLKLHQERFVNHNWKFLDGLAWPWQCLNQIYTGIKPGLHIVAALPGQGKTAMSVDLSCYWNVTGVKHGYVCIDMSAAQLADRYPAMMSQVSLARLNFGAPKGDVDLFADGWKTTANFNNVWITEVDDTKRIRELVYRGVKSLGWKAIIVDYLQLVSPDGVKSDLAYLRVKYATQELHKLAKELKIPVIALVQLNKNFATEARKEGRGAELDDLGDSSEIARAAETILVMYKDHQISKYWETTPPTQLAFGDKNDVLVREGFVQGETSEQANARRGGQLSLAKILRPMWVDVIKNRQGGPGKIPFVFYPNYLLFRPGNHLAPKSEIVLSGKTVEAPVQGFEQIMDDWIYTKQDWILEATGAMPERGYKIPGETYEEMHKRIADERAAHPDVRQFVRDEYGCGHVIEAKEPQYARKEMR